MIKKYLGKTFIETSSIGFGGAPLGDLFEKYIEEVKHATKKQEKNYLLLFIKSDLI